MPFEPKTAQEILDGKQDYMLKRFSPSKDISTIYVYAIYPIMEVIGEVQIEEIIIKTPYEVWLLMKDKIHLDPQEFLSYYNESKQAVVYKFAERTLYDQGKKIEEFGLEHAPAMLSYVD